MPGGIDAKRQLHEAFWRGEGPCLILIPLGDQELYDLNNYPARFRDPQAMWGSEMRRAEPVVDWPTDGIATVRPNLGVIFIPAIAGQDYRLPEDAMPWPGEHLQRNAIRAARSISVADAALMRLAGEFYEVHKDSGCNDIVAYHADTQGVFDIAHLLNGDSTFYELADDNESEWIAELLDTCGDLYIWTSQRLKAILGEDQGAMIHGHGTSQGVFFANAGVRMAEDTAVLISPAMIERFILPTIETAAASFGGVFAHFCGKHDEFFRALCRTACVRAIDLGNPELYDVRWLMQQCGETGTVLHSRLAAEQDEDWESYARRLAYLARETGARVILRPTAAPESRAECAAMLDLWHELTL